MPSQPAVPEISTSRWASVTKLVTALAVLVAVEEEAVGLDEPAGPPGSTVRHLLAHASGLDFEEDRVHCPPGKRRVYSNRGFEVLGALVGEKAGMPFATYLEQAVLAPLGMAGSRLEGTPAAGLVGPLDDLVRLARELFDPTVVAASTLRNATTVAFPGLAGVLPGFGRQNPLDWGLGFEVRDAKSPHWTGGSNSPATFGHFGGSGSFLWVDPEAGLACAALSGREFAEGFAGRPFDAVRGKCPLAPIHPRDEPLCVGKLHDLFDLVSCRHESPSVHCG